MGVGNQMIQAAKKKKKVSAWLAQYTEHGTLDLKVVSSSPTMGVEPTWGGGGIRTSNYKIIHGDVMYSTTTIVSTVYLKVSKRTNLKNSHPKKEKTI